MSARPGHPAHLSPRRALAAIGALSLAAVVVPGAPTTANDGSTRVIGGQIVASMADNPGTVSVADSVTHLCSGTRIAPQWILSARHCIDTAQGIVTERPSKATTNSLRHADGPNARIVDAIQGSKGDIVLFKLDCSPPGPVTGWLSEKPALGIDVRTQGWGWTTGKGGRPSPVLKQVKGKTVSYEPDQLYKGEDITAWGPDGVPFSGDSGGPLYNDKNQVIAVVSYDFNANGVVGNNKFPTYYTMTGPHDAWIRSTIGSGPAVKPYVITESQSTCPLR